MEEWKRAGATIVLLTPARQAVSGCVHCKEVLKTSLGRLIQQQVTLHVVFTADGPESSVIQSTVEATGGRSLTPSSIRDTVQSAFLKLLQLQPAGDNREAKIQVLRRLESWT